MKDNKKIHIIQYLLFSCIFFIQIIILFFFYNEFYNQKNIDDIEEQIIEINNFQDILDESRMEIFNAQKYLQDFVTTNQRSLLDSYFASLEKLSKNLDTINNYKNNITEFDDLISFHKQSFSNLPNLSSLIDSIYEISQLNLLKSKSFEIERFIFKDTTTTGVIQVNVEHKTDSLPQKGFFSRLKDAFNNTVDIKKE